MLANVPEADSNPTCEQGFSVWRSTQQHPPVQVPPVRDLPQSISDADNGPMEVHHLILDAVAHTETESVRAV